MVIGAFFSEVGTELLKMSVPLDQKLSEVSSALIIGKDWSTKEFSRAKKRIIKYQGKLTLQKETPQELKQFLLKKRRFLLRLLENPNLLEHESFTDLLWAVFHLTDELTHRDDLDALPESDLLHLSGDVQRVYYLLIVQWVFYMQHLKRDYPYLFSLALRTNPFDHNASVVVT